MRSYVKYKDTDSAWIGAIPEHWELKRLANFGEFLKGRGISKADLTEAGLPAITYGDLYTRYRNVILQAEKFVPETIAKVAEPLRKGDLLFTGSGETPEDIGRCAAYLGDEVAYAGGDINIYRQDENDSKFLSYCLNTPGADQEKARLSRGQIIVHIYKSELRELKFPCPPVAEQRQIAAYLDHTTALIDQLIDKNTALLDLLDQQRKAIINESVTKGLDPKAPMKESGIGWLGTIPSTWRLSSLRYLTSKIGSGVTPRGGAAIYTENGIPFIRSQNVHFDGLRLDGIQHIPQAIHDEMLNTKVEHNDVLLNITGASIGRCCIVRVDQEMNVNQHVCILRTCVDLIPEYLNLVMQSAVGQTQVRLGITGGNREGLNMEQLKGFIIPLPPVEDQHVIAKGINERLDIVDQTSSLVIESNDKLVELRTSLISEAVTGKIDLREWAPEPKSIVQ